MTSTSDLQTSTGPSVDQTVAEPEGAANSFDGEAPGAQVGAIVPQPITTMAMAPVGRYETFWQEFVKVGDYSWTSSGAVGSTVFSIDPIRLFLAKPSVARKVANFGMATWDAVEVKITLNGATTMFGHVIAGAFPQGAETYVGGSPPCPTYGATPKAIDELPTMWQITHGRHIHFAPGPGVNGTFVLPWINHQDATSLTNIRTDGVNGGGPQTQWRVTALVNDALGNSTNTATVTNCNFAVYVRLLNPVFSMPLSYQSKTQGSVGKMSAAVSAVASKLKAVPLVSQYASAVELVSSAVGSVADHFGFSREPYVPQPSRATLTLFSELPFADGVDTSTTLALLKDNKVAIDPIFAGDGPVDDMSFASIFARPGQVARAAWACTTSINTQLLAVPVNPTFCYAGGNIMGQPVYLTPVGFVASHFRYWRGPMFYEIRVHASSTMSGRLQVWWSPTTGAPVDPGQDPTEVSHNCIMDVTGPTVKRFRVGWCNPNTFRKVARSTFGGTTTDAEADNGVLYIRVVNELTAPDPTCFVNVQVYAYSDGAMVLMDPTGYLDYRLRLQSEDVCDLVPTPDVDPTAIIGGERLTSISTLLDRPHAFSYIGAPSLVGNLQAWTTNWQWSWTPQLNPQDTWFDGGADNSFVGAVNGTFLPRTMCDPLTTLPQMFLGWRGGLRLKFKFFGYPGHIYTTNSEVDEYVRLCGDVMVQHRPIANNSSWVSGSVPAGIFERTYGLGEQEYGQMSGLVVCDSQQANGVEVTVPHYAPRKYTLTRVFPQGAPTSDPGIVLSASFAYKGAANSSIVDAVVGVALRSAASDFMLVAFRFVPTCHRTV